MRTTAPTHILVLVLVVVSVLVLWDPPSRALAADHSEASRVTATPPPPGYYPLADYATLKPRAGEPQDEAALRLGLTIDSFRPEKRDLFWQMDQVANSEGVLHPLDFDYAQDRSAIYGRNTWLLWCGGNEGFWDWLAQDGYGYLDFLKMLDSRRRDRRFRDLGLLNQPGLRGTDQPGPWGLYLDRVAEELGQPPPPGGHGDYDKKTYDDCVDPEGRRLRSDGVDPKVYGYPSGVIGLRLFPNPRFQNDSAAQRRWNPEAFYSDPDYGRDPSVVRPFRVGMSCAICHVAPHPLNPPADPENSKWENLSSIAGNQYFRTSAVFGSRVERGNFIWHYLASQQPGTIDTSLVSTDHINNANTMNAVFEVPARVALAALNPAEKQGRAAQTLPTPFGEGVEWRRTPRVLLQGDDSIGVFGALARVYLNIGTFYEEWNTCHNPIIGFRPQRPFEIDVCRRNSLYWRVNESFRVGHLIDFFRWQKPGQPWQKATAPMRLKNAVGVNSPPGKKPGAEMPKSKNPDQEKAPSQAKAPAKANPAGEGALVSEGRRVFGQHCLLCHSSKQPESFDIDFALNLDNGTAWNAQTPSAKLILPMEWKDWEDFKRSPAYEAYAKKAATICDRADFLDDNFLSTDLRVPISLVGTNSGRALATNALAGQVWSDFSSETYKELPAVGRINYYDPFVVDAKQAERSFQPLGEGRGYYRPASLVSIWATAPLLHNNALGKYIPDHQAGHRVSVAGRLEMFDDAIEKLLWKSKRLLTPSGECGLRNGDQVWLGGDPGWIFRTDQETWIELPRKHGRRAAEQTLPPWAFWLLDHPWFLPLLGVLLLVALVALRHSQMPGDEQPAGEERNHSPRGLAARWPHRREALLVGVLALVAVGALIAASGALWVFPWWVWLLGLTVLIVLLALGPQRAVFYLCAFVGLVLLLGLCMTGAYYVLPGWIWLLVIALFVGGIAGILPGPNPSHPQTTPQPAPEEAEGAGEEAGLLPAGAKRKILSLVRRWGPPLARWTGIVALGLLLLAAWQGGTQVKRTIDGDGGDLRFGPIPKGTPVNALMNLDPDAPLTAQLGALRGLLSAVSKINRLPRDEAYDEQALSIFHEEAGPGLMGASKCPDFTMDRGHLFGESLSDQEKRALIAFLKTL